jgi:hypothetical protein
MTAQSASGKIGQMAVEIVFETHAIAELPMAT